jgi:hypothetical protein
MVILQPAQKALGSDGVVAVTIESSNSSCPLAARQRALRGRSRGRAPVVQVSRRHAATCALAFVDERPPEWDQV